MSYNVSMKDLKRAQHVRWRLAVWLVSSVILLLAFLQFVPLFVALRAGIAGLSIVVFGPLVLIAGILTFFAWREKIGRTALLAALATTVAFLALLAPIISYLSVARAHGVSVRFDAASYISFTGDSVAPAKTITYKTVEEQELKLAVYRNETSGARPTVVLLHGGGWQFGNYLRTNAWPELLRDDGYQVISVEYRLASADKPTWDKAPADVSDAVTYIKTHAPQLGVNPDRVAIFGQSAGGHLALLEANTSFAVRAVVGLYAPTDLESDYEQSIDKDSELAFLGGTPEQYPERYRSVSVPQAITSSSPSTLLVQGTSDDIVNRSSSTLLSEQLETFGVLHRLVLIPYTGHSFDNQVGGFATQIAEQVVLDFLAQTLGR